jgi:surface carbohydrate biosynthesis protein
VLTTFTKLLCQVAVLFLAKKTWCWPKRADVLLADFGLNVAYDQGVEDLLLNYTTERLHSPEINLNIPVLLSCLLRRGGLREKYNEYYVKRVRPKLVLTYIDNNLAFYKFSVKNPEIKTMFIQNGVRGYCGDIFEVLNRKSTREYLKVDYMMTFGGLAGAEYAKYIAGKVVPIGSFRNNLVPVRRKKVKGTIVFVSQYRNSKGIDMCGVFYSFEQFWERADRIIVPFLFKYARARGKTLSIVPCSAQYEDPVLLGKEKKYFNRIAGCECTFSEWQWHGSGYDAVDVAEVTVAIDSTLGLEAIARGGRAAIFSIRSTILSLMNPPFLSFGWPGIYSDDGPYWTNRPDLTAFERILDYLFSASNEQWLDDLKRERFDDLLQYDPGNSILRRILRSELDPRSDNTDNNRVTL